MNLRHYLGATFCALLLLNASAAFAVTPAERAIARAEAQLAQADTAPNRAALAMAHARRGREAADPIHYEASLTLLSQAPEAQADHPELEKARIWALLGLHAFAEALARAEALNQRFPDDLETYGMLADAAVELGRYEQAEEAVQWMLDLRPGNVAGLARAAHLRELFGDLEGAVMLFQDCLARVSPGQVEDQAWFLVHLSHLELLRGEVELAGRLADRALTVFPEYHYALDQRAKVATAAGAHAEALALRERHVVAAAHPENFYFLGQAARAAGDDARAAEAFARFETGALAETEAQDNANLFLVEYYLDERDDPTAALALAQRLHESRQDIRSRMALARALHRNGMMAEARQQAESAMAVGSRDPALLLDWAIILRESAPEQAEALASDALARQPNGAAAARYRAAQRGRDS